MNRIADTITNRIIRLVGSVLALFFALDLFACGVMFALLGIFSDVARPVAITSGLLFLLGGFVFLIAAIAILFARTDPTGVTEDGPPTQVERLVGMVVGAMGGVLVGLLLLLLVWLGNRSFDYALLAFQFTVIFTAIASYFFPRILTDVSLDIIDLFKQLGT